MSLERKSLAIVAIVGSAVGVLAAQGHGAGVRITGDRPLLRFGYRSIRTVLAAEPYIEIAVEPGQEFTSKWTYDYFVN